jgi:hypothetical protein
MSAKVLRALLSSKNKKQMKPFESPLSQMVRKNKKNKILPRVKNKKTSTKK